jgi:intracellular multiplication protein IcmE
VLILGVLGVIIASAVFYSTLGRRAPALSADARLQQLDPLPGGVKNTPEQDALALAANDRQAQQALARGKSYTVPLAPSQLTRPPPVVSETPVPPEPAQPLPQPAVLSRPLRPRLLVPVTLVAPVVPPRPQPLPQLQPQAQPEARVIAVAATSEDPRERVYSQQIGDMFSAWGARPPRTDVLLPPSGATAGSNEDPPAAAPGTAPGTAAVTPASAARPARIADVGRLLIPAGRGIFAHPILAVNSDATSPVVLQADSGPIAGDRMIGTFARESDRLVIHINQVVHQGEMIGVDGLVTAPETMEAGVASGVDQHYLTRFILPAAAAFVAGLGKAIEDTTNTVSVLSPFGGATTATHLNIDQQLGVAAGASAAQVAAVLNAAAPRGPTISLDANVAVGVMFLSDVTSHSGN